MGKQVKPKFDPNAEFTPVSATNPGESTDVTLTPQQEKPKFDPNAPFEPVKKKEPTESVPASASGTIGQDSGAGSTPSTSDTQRTEKPSARTKLKTRVKSLSAMYQGRFANELKPFLDEQQKQYAGVVDAKKNELQSLVDSGKLNVDQANSQLQEFSTTKKTEFDQKIKAEQEVASTKFDQKYGKEISKWLDLYNKEYEREDFDENRITNPFTSFKKSAWTTFSMDIPSAAYAARALGRSTFNKADQKLVGAFEELGIPQVDPETAEGMFSRAVKFITGATDEQIAKSSEIKAPTTDAVNKKMIIEDLRAATELSNASAESKKYLVNSLDKVKSGDWLDVMNYVASAAGQGSGQILTSLGTRGTTSLVQEMGSIYLDSVHKIAQESGLSVEEVINQGKDDVVFPILFGFGAGLLDAYGANRVGKLFGKDQVMNSFRQRAISVAKTTGYESLTEAAQGTLEEIGVKKAAGKSWIETLKTINPDVIMESALQGGIAALFLGGSAQTIQAGIRSMTPKVKEKFVPEEKAVSPIDAAVKRGATVSLQAEKPTKTVIEEQKTAVDPKNPESVAAAAEIIQQSFNEKQDTGLDANTESETVQPVTLSLPPDSGAVPGVREDTPQELGQVEQTSEESVAEASPLETLREQILNSPEDLRWNEGKVTILTEKGGDMLRQYQELKQQNPEATAGGTPTTQSNEQVQTEGQQGQVRLREVESEQAASQPATLKDVGADEFYSDVLNKTGLSSNDLVMWRQALPNKPDNLDLNLHASVYDAAIKNGDRPLQALVNADMISETIAEDPNFDEWRAIKQRGGDIKDSVKFFQDHGIEVPTDLTDEQNSTTEQLVAQPPDQSQQEPVGSGQGGTVVQDDITTPAATGIAPVEEPGSQTETQQPSKQPVAQVEKKSEGDAGSYTFRRPVMPPPGSPVAERSSEGTEGVRGTDDGSAGGATPPASNPPVGTGRSVPPGKGERATIVKLQDQSKLSQTLKDDIEEFKEYDVKKQSRSQEKAKKYIKKHGEDQALQDAISFRFARSQEEKMALLSELANVFSTKFKKAEQDGNQEQVDQYYNKFMTSMNTLSNFITDTAQALSYLNLVGTVFETKTGALRFAKNQIEQSREGALKNHEAMKMTAEEILKAFDALPRDEFLKSKQVQDILAKVKKESPKATRVRQANDKLSSAAQKLKDAWEKNKNIGIAYDPKSQAEKDVELTRALVDYIKAFIEKIAAESGEFIRNVGDQVSKGTKSFVKEVGIEINDDDLNNLITPQIEEFQRSTRYTQPITPAERQRAVSLIRGLLLPTDARSGTVVKPSKPAVAEFYDRLIKRVLTTDQKKATPQNRADAIEEVLKNIDKYTDVLQGVRDELQADGVDTSDIDGVFQLPFFEKALRKNQEVLDAQKLVDEHYSNVERVRSDLAKKFQDQYGLEKKDADDLELALDKVFDEWMAKEKKKIVDRFKPKTRKPNVKRTEFYDKVIKLSNVGAVSDQQLDDTIAEIFGLPAMTPEITNKIEEMVDEINKAPEGRFKNIAITKLTDYIAKQQRFNVSDYMLASFRAGIFSGVDTQALNLLGNFFNVLELGFMVSMSNPLAGARFIGSVRNPTSIARAGLEALEVLRTGFDPRVSGDARRRVLEQRERTMFGLTPGLKGWKQALDPTLEQQKKYVFRALSAGDLLFSSGINDALQNEMYARRAKEMGLTGKESAAFVHEQMGFTPEKINQALDQANNEALAGQIPNSDTAISLRAKEIIEQQRDPDIVEKSREYAQGQILTNTPNGYLGIIARGINDIIQNIPVVAGLIPVVNFATNAMQRGVQYIPPLAMLRGAAHLIGRKAKGEDFTTAIKEDLQRLKNGDLDQEMRLRRFAAGTVSLIMMTVLLSEDDEGENLLSKALGKTIKIHGFGPGTRMNRQKNYQKQESGWVPYSFQVGDTFIPYKNFPGANVVLASYGEYADAKRYGKLDKEDALNRWFFAVSNSVTVIAEMGFVTSLNNIMEALLQGEPKKWASLLARPIGGIAFPKFQQNIANFFDNKVYSGRDVQEVAIRSIPVLRSGAGDPIVNALGEDVRVDWWDRIELWKNESNSAYKPIWEANTDKNYYLTVPTKGSLELTFDRPISTEDYNKFFKLRGQEIVKEFKPEFAQLAPEEYARKMDKVTEIAKYRALVAMGVMETDLMKEIRFQLDDIMEVKRQSQQLKKDIK